MEQYGDGIQVILAYAETVPPSAHWLLPSKASEKNISSCSCSSCSSSCFPEICEHTSQSMENVCCGCNCNFSLALLPPMFIVSHFLSFVLSTHCYSHLHCLTKSDCNMMLQTNTEVLRLSSVGELYLYIDIQRISAYANRNQFN